MSLILHKYLLILNFCLCFISGQTLKLEIKEYRPFPAEIDLLELKPTKFNWSIGNRFILLDKVKNQLLEINLSGKLNLPTGDGIENSVYGQIIWMGVAPENPILDLLDLSFPSPNGLFSILIFTLLFLKILTKIPSFSLSGGMNRESFMEFLSNPISPIIMAAIAHPIVLLFLEILGSPSWEHRYMAHLIPIWQLAAVSMLLPENPIFRLDMKKPDSDSIFSISVIVIIIMSSMFSFYQIRNESQPIKQDVRRTMEFIDEDWDQELSNAIITQPSPFIFEYYLERYDLEPTHIEGSWGPIDGSLVENIINSNPDVIYRISLVEYEDQGAISDNSGLISQLSESFVLESEERPVGMIVQKWVKLEDSQ